MFHDDQTISEGAGGKSKSADDPSVALFAPARTLADCTNQAEKIPMSDFKLDEEFRQRNRKHTKQERENLEILLEEEGCIADALTLAIIGTERILCDGYTTYDICKAKGIKLTDPRCIVFKDREAVLEWMDRRQRARRNLTQEEMVQRRQERIERVAEAKQEGKSNRVIADEEGVSETTIRNDVEAAGAKGFAPEPPNGKITGKDGKSQPSEKPAKPLCQRCQRAKRVGQEPVKNCEMCRELLPNKAKPERKEKNTDDKPGDKDAFGVELPKRCRDAFMDPWIQESIDYLGILVAEFWKKRLADGMAKRKKHYPFFNVKDFVDGCAMIGNTLEQVLEHLKEFRPAGVCPSCEGKGCSDCRMSGLVPRKVHKELKAKAKK